MVPLAIVALAWIAAYSGGLFGIGFQGQIIAGGICAVVVALMVPAPPGLHLLLGILAGVAAGWSGRESRRFCGHGAALRSSRR